MPEEKTIDPETSSLDELRKAADLELQRDEKGRFVSPGKVTATEGAVTETEITDPQEVVVYRTQIDLGDGSGVQVFEAESPEELTEKLVEAQKNATIKIRQQEAELKELRARTAEKPPSKDLTDDEKYILKQEFDKDPDAALRKWFEKRTGRKVEDIGELGKRLDAEAETRQRLQAMEAFLASHEDFNNEDKIDGKLNPNGDLMRMKLAELRLPITSENLHKAYLQLKASGLLRLRTGSEANADTTTEPEATERIAQPRTETTQTRTRRTSSGISSHGRPAPPPPGFSEADAYNMPLDKLREKANAQLSGR